MGALDQKEFLEKMDRHNMLKWIEDFGAQLRHAEEIGLALSLKPDLGQGISNIVFSGLGGSAIGADFIRSYLAYEMPIPILVNRHYRLPAFVNERTLLIVSSYSGDTEETLASLKEGLNRHAKILAISSGGELARKAQVHSFPVIQIPGGMSPRAALGYSAIPLMIALSKIGFKQAYRAEEVREARELTDQLAKTQYGPSIPEDRNLAKQLASQCFKKYPIVYAGTDFLDVVALRWRGQIEENAKALASHHILPEMNHNELVGWQNPAPILKDFVVLILRDQADHTRVRMRMKLSEEIIARKAAKVTELSSQGKGLLARMMSLIHLGDWLSFYLAALYQVDPTPVEVIQYLKSELAKEPAG